MPFTIDIFPPDRMVVVVGRGEITHADLATLSKELIDRNVLTYRKIFDLTSAKPAIDKEALEGLAERFRSVPTEKPRGPVAIVSEGDRGNMARLFVSMTSDERPVQVFRSIHEARKWLLANSGSAF